MKLVGIEGQNMFPKASYMKATEDNTPKFNLVELLDRFQLNAYYSKSTSYIQQLINNQQKKNSSSEVPKCSFYFLRFHVHGTQYNWCILYT